MRKMLLWLMLSNIRNGLILLGLTLAILAGAGMSLMDIDATQYATLSRQMWENKSFLQVFLRGADYLDKPPLLFWLSAPWIGIFGNHAWAYRLPSILGLLAGIYGLYRYSSLYYSPKIAWQSVLIFASSQAFFLLMHDIRTDTLLTGMVLLACWQGARYLEEYKLSNALLFSLFTALAMLSKGPIGIIIPGIVLFAQLVFTREFKLLRPSHILAGLLLIALVLAPMSWGLYTQFDLHPEKEVYGLKGPSGLRFYYWTQSFGRISGESNWSNSPEPFFLVHSFLWSFFPWSPFFVIALIKLIRELFKSKSLSVLNEWGMLFGFLIVFVLMSLSTYQLPHYTFVIHPFAALLTAVWLNKISFSRKSLLTLKWIMIGVMLLSGVMFFWLVGWAFPNHPFLFNNILLAGFLLGISILVCSKENPRNALVWTAVLWMSVLNLILNTLIYPELFKYQAFEQVAHHMNKEHPGKSLEVYKCDYWFSLDYFMNENIIYKPSKQGEFVLTDEKGFVELNRKKELRLRKEFQHYPISNLSLEFLNPYTRRKTLNSYFLFERLAPK